MNIYYFSPLQGHQNKLMEKLLSAERHAESLRTKLADIVKELQEDGKCDTSMSSLALDVSKISILKVCPRVVIGIYIDFVFMGD